VAGALAGAVGRLDLCCIQRWSFDRRAYCVHRDFSAAAGDGQLLARVACDKERRARVAFLARIRGVWRRRLLDPAAGGGRATGDTRLPARVYTGRITSARIDWLSSLAGRRAAVDRRRAAGISLRLG